MFHGAEHVVEIFPGGYFCALNVGHGVVAHRVPASQNFLIEFRVAGHIVAHDEESGLNVIFVESVEHPGCDFGNGSVVECEIYGVLFLVDSPDGFREEHTVE